MQSVLSLLLSVLASLSSSVPGRIVQGRTECPEGYILWPEDSSCHRPYYRGPCSGGQVLINHPQVRIKEEDAESQQDEGAEQEPQSMVHLLMQSHCTFYRILICSVPIS